MKARNRDGLDQNYGSCTGVRETTEHFIVECDRYEEERDRLIGSIATEIGVEEWHRRLEEEDGRILTVLYKGESQKERERLIKAANEFLGETAMITGSVPCVVLSAFPLQSAECRETNRKKTPEIH